LRCNHRDGHFGNGRVARNVVEKIQENMAKCLDLIDGKPTPKQLTTVLPEDGPAIDRHVYASPDGPRASSRVS
jgi:hypothetical protein